MIIAALNESVCDWRVAITPNTVKHYKKLNLVTQIEQGSGKAAGFDDEDYQNNGAIVITNGHEICEKTNILTSVNKPKLSTLSGLSAGSLIIAPVDKTDVELITWCAEHQVYLFSMNLIPRITRAQSMDSLSSQANLAGYRAVIEAVYHFHRAIPMMMTAAGMIHPAKFLILGAGVAGLQAIATAKRLGGVVYAFDVRAAAKAQVESVGAEFITVSDENFETASGYATSMSHHYQQQQAQLIDNYAALADIIITTALIPGKKAPVLITKQTLMQMKKGSVIIDLATARGGNCDLSEDGKAIDYQGITIIGQSNMAGLVPATASELYATNVANLMPLLVSSEQLFFDQNDEIIQQGLLYNPDKKSSFQSNKAV